MVCRVKKGGKASKEKKKNIPRRGLGMENSLEYWSNGKKARMAGRQ